MTITPPGATGDDPYEPNNDKPTVDTAPAGGVNSPNLGILTATKTINNLVMNDAADWFRFQTQGVGGINNSVSVTFDTNAGDLDLYLYAADGTTLMRSAPNDPFGANNSPETISLAGIPSGTYYAVVKPHATGFGIDNYTLTIAAPGATGDDGYEPNNDKPTVDTAPAGGVNSPNLGILTATKTINNLVMNDGIDMFRFQTQGVGGINNAVSVTFNTNAGDLDLYLYRSDGTTLVRRRPTIPSARITARRPSAWRASRRGRITRWSSRMRQASASTTTR